MRLGELEMVGDCEGEEEEDASGLLLDVWRGDDCPLVPSILIQRSPPEPSGLFCRCLLFPLRYIPCGS